MSLPRFHVPEAAPGALVTLPAHAAHHARDVLRLRAGAAVRVFDGRGHEFEATLDEVSHRGVAMRLGAATGPRPESPLRIVLAVSPLKGDRMELVIQKATELGVAQIWPVVAARTDAAARPALEGSRQGRWEKVASAAAEQSGRAVVPGIAPARTLDALIAVGFAGLRLLFEAPAQTSLGALARPHGGVLALVGPAGGWEAAEVHRLVGAGFVPVGLGPRILRAETAALAVVTTLQALWGDLT